MEGVIVEQAWISVTYEEGYSKAYDAITEVMHGGKVGARFFAHPNKADSRPGAI
ncbi:MAG: hypothetical protein NTY51_00125 [Deltaproteobacteria bacterium]|nr:hypothetical protein [Deltaproteobacteria bacterium]